MIIGDFRRFPVVSVMLLGVVVGLASLGQARPLVARKTRIIAIGDSTTAGTPFFVSPLEAPPDGQGDPEGQYSYWMMRKKPSWEILNFGINGQTTNDVRIRFIDALAKSPRFIIVFAGVNDIMQNIPLAKTSDNLLWMYEQAKASSVMPVAVTVCPFNAATTEQALAIDVLNRWIRKQAELMRIPLVDANAAVRDAENLHKLNGSSDELHPDIGGYRAIGMKMIQAIEPVEKAWR